MNLTDDNTENKELKELLRSMVGLLEQTANAVAGLLDTAQVAHHSVAALRQDAANLRSLTKEVRSSSDKVLSKMGQ